MANQFSTEVNNLEPNTSREDVFVLLNKIMSEDCQPNYMEQLESYSDILLLLLRNIFDQNEEYSNRDLIETILHESEFSSNKEINIHANGDSLDLCSPISGMCLKNYQSVVEGISVGTEKSQQKRKRKTKYSDIIGDTSHIHREPKRKRRKTADEDADNNVDDTINYSRSNITMNNKDIYNMGTGEKREDILLVQKLMTFLFYPETKYHQDCALAVLRSDEKLMELFLKEKDKLGKQKIPVFKKRIRHLGESNTSQQGKNQEMTCHKLNRETASVQNGSVNIWKASEDSMYVPQAQSTQPICGQDKTYLESDIASRINLIPRFSSRDEMINLSSGQYLDTQLESNVNYNQENFLHQTQPCTIGTTTEATIIEETFFHEYF